MGMVLFLIVLSCAFMVSLLNTISLIMKQEDGAFRGKILTSFLFAVMMVFFYTS